MKRFVSLVCGFCLLLLITVSLSGAEESPLLSGEPYELGPGDVLDISVWKDEAQTKTVVVLPDGTISFPLIGEVMAAGKTVGQLKEEIRQKVSTFVPDPVLTVIVHQVNSMLIYVVGRVNNPGRFLLSTNINVLQALTMAGGLNPFAKRDKITIMREGAGETKIFTFNYDEVAAGENLTQNIRLRRGDVVVVP
ncbi:MAG: polysaccharide biosynthesis/export family protein [Deltaproteobacteria bacterium]|nr:polysaccharide biosynthesis/export family protein [Deltaproteobacteria bacterium]